MRQASLFSSEHCNLASASSRSFCLCKAAANSGSRSAASLVFSSRDNAESVSVGGSKTDVCNGEVGMVEEVLDDVEASLGMGEEVGVGMPLALFTGGRTFEAFCFLA